MKNNALNYTQRCSISSISEATELRLQNQEWWNCTQYDPMHVDYPSNQIFTSILYGGDKNILGINETWYCDDQDPSKPYVFLGFTPGLTNLRASLTNRLKTQKNCIFRLR